MTDCLKKKRKPMVPLKTLDIIFRRRYVPNTQHYFTNRKFSVLPDKEKGKPSVPFKVPRSEKLLSYIKYSDRKGKLSAKETLSKPLHKKDNIKIAMTRDISRRLYLEEPPDDVRAVVEIHPEFYTVIEGRPLRCFDDIKVYVNNIRNYAMNKQQIGYRNDLILKLARNTIEEEKEYEKISRDFKYHIKNFQKFLTEDYKKACSKVSQAEKVTVELVNKNSEFLTYVTKVTILNNILFKLDAIRSVLKSYRRYLMFVAPLTWRQVYDENLRSKLQSIQFDAGEFVTDNDLVESMDIDKMIEVAGNELKNPLLPCLYFTDPEQMVYMFRTMELQSREYLKQLSKTDIPYRLLQDRIRQLGLATKQESDYFQYYIDRINIEIIREQYNENELQVMFYRILNGSFYESVASPDTLKLKICIEFVYEEVFGKCEEGHENIMDPMKILEVTYEDLNLKLDSLDFKIVNEARKDCFAQDLKMMKNAYKAARELKAFKEMTNAMNKAFYPPAKFKLPDLKKNKMAKKTGESDQPDELNNEFPVEFNYKLTPDERDALLTFTNWCDGQNPAPYLEQYYKYVKPVFSWLPRKSVIP